MCVCCRDEPQTIHLAGEKLRQEKLAVQAADQQRWQQSLVVDDPRTYVHRCLPQTEMTDRGRKATNQIELLKVAIDSLSSGCSDIIPRIDLNSFFPSFPSSAGCSLCCRAL